MEKLVLAISLQRQKRHREDVRQTQGVPQGCDPLRPKRQKLSVRTLPCRNHLLLVMSPKPKKVLKRKAFIYTCCSLDGSDAVASNGSTIWTDCAIDGVDRPDLLAVCSSDGVERIDLTPAQKAVIRKLCRPGPAGSPASAPGPMFLLRLACSTTAAVQSIWNMPISSRNGSRLRVWSTASSRRTENT